MNDSNQHVGISLLLAVILSIALPWNAAAAFIEPTEWGVGDLHTTSQKWANNDAAPPIAAAPVAYSSNPASDENPALSWSGSYVANSGGLYSFSTNYTISAQIPGHSPAGSIGTYIIVQTAGTMNPDYNPEGNSTGGGLLRETFKIYDSMNNLVETSSASEVTRRFYDPIYPLFGGVGYEELIWQVFVPNLVGDFRVAAEAMVHSSLQALRIDSLVSTSVPGDFDSDGDVDGSDFIAWQTNFPKSTNAAPAQGDADGDGDVDGADFANWQNSFPFTPAAGVAPVPEPTAVLSAIVGVGSLIVCSFRLRNRRSEA